MTFLMECIEGITGDEDELLITIRKGCSENAARRLFGLMMNDKVHKDGLDVCILDGVNEYSYYGYNLMSFACDTEKLDDEDLDIRVTFRKEYATTDKEEGGQ